MQHVKRHEVNYKFYSIFYIYLFLILTLRKPDSLFYPQFFAEDSIWFKFAFLGGVNLFETTAGYCQFIPRLIAIIANLFSCYYAPFIYNFFAISIAAFCCFWISLPLCKNLIKSLGIRLIISVMIALVPTAHEIIGNITNLQWYLNIWGAIFCISKLPPNRYLRITCYLFFISSLMTSPTFIIFLPILVIRIIKEEKYKTEFSIVACFLILYTTITILTSSQLPEKSLTWTSIYNITQNFLLYLSTRTVSAISLCHNLENFAVSPNIFIPLGCIFTFSCFIWAYIICRKVRNTKYIFLYTAYICFSSILIFVVLRVNESPKEFSTLVCNFTHGSRYSVLPCAMIYLIAGLTIEYFFRNGMFKIPFCMVFILLTTCILNYNFNIKYYDFNWKQWSKILDQGKKTGTIENNIPINPPDWKIRTTNG